MSRIVAGPGVSIDSRCIEYRFLRASGPGGQNVNKVETAVELRYDMAADGLLPDTLRERLIKLAGRRMTAEGMLVIQAQRFRSQQRNREDALDRLIALVGRASVVPRSRVPTRPSAAVQRARVETKRRQATVKRSRRRVKEDEI